MKKVKHINFTVYPTQNNVGWGKLKTVNISVPKNKFTSLENLKNGWYKKTGNVATKIVKGSEKVVNHV